MGTKFSQQRCREMAHVQMLMMEMPETACVLASRIITLLSCDYDATQRLEQLTNEIYRGGNDSHIEN